jgi:hypothetical protein
MLGCIFVSFAFFPIKLVFARTLLTPVLALDLKNSWLQVPVLPLDYCRERRHGRDQPTRAIDIFPK